MTFPRRLASLFTPDEMAALDSVPCGANCSRCDELLASEGDFYRHFTVLDSRFRNLGNCSNCGPIDSATTKRP